MLGLASLDNPFSIDYFSVDLSADGKTITMTDTVGFDKRFRANKPLMEFMVDGRAFDDCIIANLSNSERVNFNYNNEDTLHATEFIWSKRYGLLQYQMEGETYTRKDIENLK